MTGRRLRYARAGLLLATLCFAVIANAASSILSARLAPAADVTRLTIDSAAALTYRLFTIPNPARVVLDIESNEALTALEALSGQSTAGGSLVKAVRVGRFKPGITRLVIDLKSDAHARVSRPKPAASGTHQLVLTLYPHEHNDPVMALLEGKASPAAAPAEAAVVPPTTPAAPAPTAAQVAQTNPEPSPARIIEPAAEPVAPPAAVVARKAAETPSTEKVAAHASAGTGAARPAVAEATAPEPSVERLVTVAVDAGHGGEDPGAKGRNGTYEKHVTLAIARKLKEVVDTFPNMRAVLVRDADYFVPLQARVVKARAVQADLFVSIHADAFVKPNARGSSVFALSERGATSAAARWIAKRENDADLIGGVNIDVPDPFLKKVLLDLSQTATINDSLKLGRAVLGELRGVNSLHKARVEQAGFAVLKAPDMPSILIETAFISNPEEETRLTDEAYYEKMARAIAGGIKRYFARNPPLARAHLARSDTPDPIADDSTENRGKGAAANGMQFAVFDPTAVVEKTSRPATRRSEPRPLKATRSKPAGKVAATTSAGKTQATCKRSAGPKTRRTCLVGAGGSAKRR